MGVATLLRPTAAPSGASASGTSNSRVSFATFDALMVVSCLPKSRLAVLSWPNPNWSQSYLPPGSPATPEVPEVTSFPGEASFPAGPLPAAPAAASAVVGESGAPPVPVSPLRGPPSPPVRPAAAACPGCSARRATRASGRAGVVGSALAPDHRQAQQNATRHGSHLSGRAAQPRIGGGRWGLS